MRDTTASGRANRPLDQFEHIIADASAAGVSRQS
jgi:hypothetical protein